MHIYSQLIALFLCFTAMFSAQADEIWGNRGFEGFAKSQPLVDQKKLESFLGREWTEVIFKTGLEPSRIFKPDFQHIDPILERAVEAKMGILELFTQGELADARAPAILLDESLLERINSK